MVADAVAPLMALRLTGSTNADVQALEDAVREELARIEGLLGQRVILPVADKDARAQFGRLLPVDPTDGAVAVQLPQIRSVDVGRSLFVHEYGGSTNAITVYSSAPAQINGATSYASSTANATLEFVAMSTTRWAVFGA